MSGIHAGSSPITTAFDSSVDNSAQALKVARGHLYGIFVQNPNASDAWVQFFDAATGNVTVGTTTPKMSYVVPANGAIELSFTHDTAVKFGTAITYAATTTATGSTNPTTALVGNFLYR